MKNGTGWIWIWSCRGAGIVIVAFTGWRVFLGKVLELLYVLYHPISCALFYVSRRLHSALFFFLN